MKKTIKILLIALCISLFNIKVAFAAGATASMKVDKETVKAGESIQIILNTSSEEGISAVVGEIEYDENVLTLEEIEVADKWINYGDETKLELLINSATKVTELDVCTITFKVNDNASEGTTEVSLNEVQITDISNNINTVENVEKTVNIATAGGEKPEPPAPTEKELSSIEITEAPNKKVYTEGEKFDKTGMKITAKYSDGNSKEITEYTCSPDRELKTTDTKITISYTENGVTKTVEQKVTVTKKSEETNSGNIVDNSTSGKEFPKTGAETIIVLICLVIVIAVVSYIKYIKHKSI